MPYLIKLSDFMAKQLPKPITTPKYWDCECESDYVHPQYVTICPKCKAVREEQPNSMISEVIAAGFNPEETFLSKSFAEQKGIGRYGSAMQDQKNGWWVEEIP